MHTIVCEYNVAIIVAIQYYCKMAMQCTDKYEDICSYQARILNASVSWDIMRLML